MPDGDQNDDKARTEWVKIQTTGPLRQDGRVVDVTQEYLDKTVRAFERYQQDLAEAGMEWCPPVIHPMFGPHTDSGRRDGDVLDLKTETGELWARIRWRPEAWQDRQDGKLEQLSVNIQPKYTDPQLNKTYSPYFKELSPTVHGKDKRAGISAAVTELTASELDEMGLDVQAATDEETTMQQDGDMQDGQVTAQQDGEKPPQQTEQTAEPDEGSGGSPGSGSPIADLINGMLEGLPKESRGRIPGRQDVIDDLDAEADMDIQRLMSGEVVFPTDQTLEAIADFTGVAVEDLRAGNFGGRASKGAKAAGDKDEGMEAADETDETGDEPDGEVTAADGDDEPTELLAEAHDRIDELEAKLERRDRAAQMNTTQTSSPGERPLTAAEKEGEETDDEPDWSGMSDMEALEKAKEDEGLEGKEAFSFVAEKRQGNR